MEISRRAFLAGAAAATAAAVVPAKPAEAAVGEASWATLIDLTRCDGCADRPTPACVTGCREANAERFPEPDPAMLKDYWPQDFHDDWSKKRGVIDRLTPYNWTFVQKAKLTRGGETAEVFVPRRCMHCDSPACVKLCPFGVNRKYPEGPVAIDPYLCFGGAKCKQVCPWQVPQRQAGVGVYAAVDPIPAGGGVMFKCDLCRERIGRGELPACVPACPRKAIEFGRRGEIYRMAEERAAALGGHVYGMKENGGTATLYVSAIPFEEIDKALTDAAPDPTKVMRLNRPKNRLDESRGFAVAALLAPLAGIATAFLATASGRKEKKG